MRIHRLLELSLLLLVLTVLISARSSPTSAPSTDMPKMAMADMPGFVKSAPPTVQQAYQFAVTNPHALETVPCYCGCGKMGHKSNLKCFIKDASADGKIAFDDHAANCGICVDIAQDVMRLRQQGNSLHTLHIGTLRLSIVLSFPRSDDRRSDYERKP